MPEKNNKLQTLTVYILNAIYFVLVTQNRRIIAL